MKSTFTFILALLTVIAANAQKSELNLNLKEGKEYDQVMFSRTSLSRIINGEEMKMVMSLRAETAFLVKTEGQLFYELEVRYKSLSMEVQLQRGTITFSSEKQGDYDILSRVLAGMTDKPFIVRMTRKGRVDQIRDIDSLFASVFNSFPQLPEEQKFLIKEQIVQLYGETAFKSNIQMVTAIFPDDRVSPGEKWISEIDLESGIAVHMVTTYELIDEDDSGFKIRGVSKIEPVERNTYLDTNGVPMKYNITGTMSSEIKVDRNSGWIIEAVVNQEIHGDTFIKENPQLTAGLKIPMTMKNEMIIMGK